MVLTWCSMDQATTSLTLESTEVHHSVGGVRLGEGAGEQASVSFTDTVIANHTGAVVYCVPAYGAAAGDALSQGDEGGGGPPIALRRCAAVQNQPEGGSLGHGQQVP
eukprot:COSAG05_NODE_3793_length_1834_cov_1.988473_3_plen_106_part_01